LVIVLVSLSLAVKILELIVSNSYFFESALAKPEYLQLADFRAAIGFCHGLCRFADGLSNGLMDLK